LTPPDDDLTLDELIRGRIRVWQPRVGYRVNVDSLLLAHFVGAPPLGRVCDLGAGVGVIGIALAARDPSARVTLAELQPRSAALARRNVLENALGDRVDVVEVDLADLRASRAALPGASFDRVVSSPPWFPLSAGPPVPDESEAIARHELRLRVDDLARACRRLLAPGGRAYVVYTSERLPALLVAFEAAGLRAIRLRAIQPRPGAPANRVLLEAHKGGRGGLVMEPPLNVRTASGDYDDEAKIALGEA
jgi:tRNA1(Val) A37 N6-methylase TrmN6